MIVRYCTDMAPRIGEIFRKPVFSKEVGDADLPIRDPNFLGTFVGFNEYRIIGVIEADDQTFGAVIVRPPTVVYDLTVEPMPEGTPC